MQSEALKKLATDLRSLVKLAESIPETKKTAYEKLDSRHVLNFIKFFPVNDRGV